MGLSRQEYCSGLPFPSPMVESKIAEIKLSHEKSIGLVKSSLEFLCYIVQKNTNNFLADPLLLHLSLATIPVPAHAFLKHFFTPRFSGSNRLTEVYGRRSDGGRWVEKLRNQGNVLYHPLHHGQLHI